MTMHPGYERALLTRAHAATADTSDLAEEVTGILGGARAARLDPGALPALASAALALGADSLAVYRAQAPRYTDDTEYATAIEETEDILTSHARAATQLRHEASTALADARADLAQAHRELAAARAMTTSEPCDGCHSAQQAAITTATRHITQARQRAEYAQQARNILSTLTSQLGKAVTLIRRALPDLAGTYETVYQVRHHGHLMPKDGDWLTGHNPAS